MPAPSGRAHAFVVVEDQPIEQPVATIVDEERPLVGRLLVAQWMLAREDPAELMPEGELAGEASHQRPQAAQQNLLAPEQACPLTHHAGVEQQHAGELEGKVAVEVARQQLGRDRAPMSCAISTTGSEMNRSTTASAMSAWMLSELRSSGGLSDSPKPKKSKAVIDRSGNASMRCRQSYELDG
jgi:hypothetical protein